jgi:hypothetical protein
MADNYDGNKDQYAVDVAPLSSRPARRAFAVTPSDTADLTNTSGDHDPTYAKALYIGVSGDVTVITAGDNSANGAGASVLFKAHPVGYMPVQVRRVLNTGTTATNILALMD